MTTNKTTLIEQLHAFISQRSGMDARNYISDYRDIEGRRAYQSEMREIVREGKEARILLRYVEIRDSITAEDILKACRSAFSGRLSWNEEKQRFDYCTGQYFPTEYRAAVCSVLSSAIWHWLEDGTDRRQWAKREFGRGLASRWFN